MPIFDQTYQHWTGTPQHRSPAWILARAQLRLVLARKTVRLLLLAAGIFLLVWGALVYFETQVVRVGPLSNIAGVVRVDAPSFRTFLVRQRLVHLLLCLALADLIALDRRARALQIYLSRPVRVRDYLLGRSLAVVVPLSLATWVPGLFIVLLKSALKANVTWMGDQAWLPLAIVGYSVALIVPLTLVTLALSSLSRSPRHASALLFAFLALTGASGQVLSVVTRSPHWQLLSLNADLDRVASWMFNQAPARELSLPGAIAALVGISLVSGLVLWRQIRPLEVVSSR
jgi:hypothetical protein